MCVAMRGALCMEHWLEVLPKLCLGSLPHVNQLSALDVPCQQHNVLVECGEDLQIDIKNRVLRLDTEEFVSACHMEHVVKEGLQVSPVVHQMVVCHVLFSSPEVLQRLQD